MFAPYCPVCRHRVLLGPRRIARSSSSEPGDEVTLLCFCGTLVAWNAEPPRGFDREEELPERGEGYRYDSAISAATSTARSVSAAT